MSMQSRFAPLRSPGFTAILLIALILAIQYGGLWYGMRMMEISKDNELERHLIDLGRATEPSLRRAANDIVSTAAGVLEGSIAEERDPVTGLAVDPAFRAAGQLPPDPFLLTDPQSFGALSGAQTTRLLEALAGPSERFSKAAAPLTERLVDLTLIDEDGRVLYSHKRDDPVAATFEFFRIEQIQFFDALNNRPSGSLTHASTQQSRLKRVYVPIFSSDETISPDANEAVAVLCLSAGVTYLEGLEKLALRMSTLSMVSAALVLSVGLLVYQLLVRQRKFERQVAHQDRLSSLGSLAAGFAHEVRNPLEIISACTEDLERSLAGRPGLAADAIESCRDIMEEVDRLNRLVGQFLAYARPTASGGDLQSAPADECVASVAGMLRHVAEKRRVIVESSFSGDGARTRTRLDGGALRQVLINLTLNAIQATPSGGLVRLSGAVEGRNLRLIVEDSGPGIPPAIRGKIFDPFFTTRDDGSGLGLSIAHQLVVRSGGRLECDDRPLGKGARFTVTLPLTERPPMATVAAPKPVET